MLIKRVFEVDPLKCPHCGGQMKVISFIERRQHDVIERILRHCGLWEGPIRTLASPRAPPVTAVGDLEFVPDLDFLESQRHEHQPLQTRELQLVLDPEYRNICSFSAGRRAMQGRCARRSLSFVH